MAYLLDTSVLVRLANKADAQHSAALTAIVELHRVDEVLCVTPQVLVEFRSVATRPKESNGLGLSSEETVRQSTVFETVFPLLAETADVFTVWKRIVETLQVTGKQVHDARLIAVCQAHGVSHLLTFNIGHLRRLALCGPSVQIASPVGMQAK